MPHRIKVHILQTLRAAEGEWVSGEALRAPFGISRVAVSKQVRSLREKGYQIESSPRKGYRLFGEPDDLSPEAVLPLLKGTRFARANYQYLQSTPSTNDVALALARKGAPEGSLVLAEEQSAGRGRRGRGWFGSPGDSLTFSMVLRPPLEPARCALLPLLAAVAVRGGLADLGFSRVGIKWPNDVLVEGKKFGGILCEMSSEFDRVEHAVIGIGLNINTPHETFPEEIADIACSLRGVTGILWKRSEILAAVLHRAEHYLTLAWTNDFDAVLRDWRAGSVTLGRRVRATLPDGTILHGMAVNLDPSGALVLEEDNGKRRLLTGGEISLGVG